MSYFRRLFFNLWYFRKPPWDTGISPPELFDFIEHHPPGRALDLGCGTGTNVITLAQHGWQVTGVDFAPRAVKKARKRVKEAGEQAELLVNDVLDLSDLTGPYDLILDIGCFHGISQDDVLRYSENLERLLTPGGYFLLYAFIKDPSESHTGLVESDLVALSAFLEMVDRQDGKGHDSRPSAWMTYLRRK
jgi:cyclopropane fatty-acyl-phospholipid synthase-like methyltransferase